MNKLKKISALSLSIVLVSVLFMGCTDKNDDKDSKTNSTVKTDVNEDIVSTELPTEDAFGEDLKDVERYPNSVRTYFVKDSSEIDVTYQTKESEKTIRDFYTKLLTEKGWKQTATATDYLDFEKGSEDNPEIMTVYLTPDTESGILEYSLTYSPALTEAELLELNSEE